MKERIFYVKDGKKYWRIGRPKSSSTSDLRDMLREDLKDTDILTEGEFRGRYVR